MTPGPWEDLLLEVLGESDATPEWDHLLHHVEDRFDARQFEGEIQAALEGLEAEGRISYSGPGLRGDRRYHCADGRRR